LAGVCRSFTRTRERNIVLVLTENAQSVIRSLTDQPEVPTGTGLRIAPAPETGEELQLSLAPSPAPGDEVIDSDGVRVFIEPGAATLLSDQTLDAQVTDAGAGFYLTAQQA
jgi:iron-sulfur cluster assembly protein